MKAETQNHEVDRQQQHDRVVVDRAICALRRYYTGYDHQDSTEQRRGWTVQRKDFELPAANENVGDREDYRCDKLPLPVIHSAWIPDGTSLFNEQKFLCGAPVECIASPNHGRLLPSARLCLRIQ